MLQEEEEDAEENVMIDEESQVSHQKYPFRFVIKKNNNYTCIATEKLKFLDIVNFLAPGFSYEKYLTAFGVEQKKYFFPYEYFTSLEKLEETCLPHHMLLSTVHSNKRTFL